MKLVIITKIYPSPVFPGSGPFVKQLVWAMARYGHDCTVINPVSYLDKRFGPLPEYSTCEAVAPGIKVKIYRPRYFSFSSKKIAGFHTGNLSNYSFQRKAVKEIHKLKLQPDTVYGHFMYPSGYSAVIAGDRFKCVSIVGVGESEFWTIVPMGKEIASKQISRASGVLAVSSHLKDMLKSDLKIPEEKIRVIPNGVDLEKFYPKNERDEMCRDLGLPSDTFNIAYVGPCTEKKGFPQLRKAVENLDNVKIVFLGRAPLPPIDDKVVFAGTVEHDRVADYLCACDIFALPTSFEGSCNSVIEAMACGLPIVTSNGRHMDDIVDDSVSVRVDPHNIDELKAGIDFLKNNPEKRRCMGQAGLERAKELNIDTRAEKITNWIDKISTVNRTQ